MFYEIKDGSSNHSIDDPLVSGYLSGLRRGEVTKGCRLTQQVTAMLELMVSDVKNKEPNIDFKVGELIGLVQWVEANGIVCDEAKQPG